MAMIKGPFGAEVISDTNTTHSPSQFVYFTKSAAEQFDFFIDGAWVEFGTIQPGDLIPIRATGARDSGNAAPTAGDLIFLR